MPRTKVNGHDHFWEEFGSASSSDVMVMLHGAAGSGRAFYPVAEQLARDGWRVIVPDMRAMGRSEHVAEIPPSAWVDDLAALLDYLKVQKAVIEGTSLGMRVALKFGILHPDRVRALVLESSIVANEAGGNAALNQNFSALSDEMKARHKANHGDDWETVVKNYFSIRNKPELQEFYNLREAAKTVQLPTLLLRGDKDEPVHPLAHTVELRQSMQTSRMAVVPNNGTGVIGTHPDEFRRLLKQFMATMATQAAS
ncbi:MAG: alpha/beta hydrolase [SAR202 cluster bacterium]|nr:alpha/beta hydrolase [SAR202 cluster bacterium]